jgi:hypothetical protein
MAPVALLFGLLAALTAPPAAAQTAQFAAVVPTTPIILALQTTSGSTAGGTFLTICKSSRVFARVPHEPTARP